MRGLVWILTMTLVVGLGCRTTTGDQGAGGSSATETTDGLSLVKSDESGKLFLRDDHGIGGYDAIAIVPSFVNYKRSSNKLDSDLETAYLASMEQAIFDAAKEANIEIVNKATLCVIEVAAGFVNLDIARPNSSAPILGTLTLIMEFRDSVSDQSLMRFVAPKHIEREPEGIERADHIRSKFDQMIGEIKIISALRAARIAPSEPRPGCKGALLRAGPPDPDLL